MDEFINKVEAFCNDGGFLEIGLRDPEVLRAYAETAQKLRRNNRKPLSHDEKMLLTRIEVIFCGAYGDINLRVIHLTENLQCKESDLERYLKCFLNKEGNRRKYHKSFVQSCMDKESTVKDSDLWIKYWQTHNTGKTLMDFLGLDAGEYRRWAETSGSDNHDQKFFIEVLQSRKEEKGEKVVC
jgi:uncharacterized protein YifE (UPF0438 family)